MIILAIDIGNTRIKGGLHQDGGWLRQGWVRTAEAGALTTEFAALPPAERIVISNVAGAAARAQVTAALSRAACPLQWIAATKFLHESRNGRQECWIDHTRRRAVGGD